jgi:serine/threonine protein kinase
LLQNQTSKHLKTSENLNFKVNLQNLENYKYEKEFEEKGLIGCGGFGIVYKSIKRVDGKVCAIKYIALNENEINSVNKELGIISQLKSNFVVEFINFWVQTSYFEAGNKGFLNTYS